MAQAQRRVSKIAKHLSSGSIGSKRECATTRGCSADESKLELTLDNGVLTRDQREFYEKNGYVLVRKLVDANELQRYTEHFVKICNNQTERVPTMTIMKDVSQKGVEKKGQHNITKVQDFQDDPVLFGYCKNEHVVRYVSAFVGPNIKSVHTMLIHKPPGIGESGRHPYHQDLHYFPFRPANRIVCAWTAMEKITRANGGLSVVPGSHLRPGVLLHHSYPEFTVNKAYHGIQGYTVPSDQQRVFLDMDVGDTVFFHPLLIHGSGANRTENYRKAISCHYASADCQYIDVKGTVQEEIGQEVEAIAARKLGKLLRKKLTFQDVWRMKSRLVAGRDGTL